MIRFLLSATAGLGVSLIVLDRMRLDEAPTGRRPHLALAWRPMVTALGSGLVAWVLFGSLVVAVGSAFAALVLPSSVAARERRRVAEVASDGWPRLLDEARVLCGPGGLSLPQALFTAGRSAGPELRAAWERAEPAWHLTADLSEALPIVRRELGDPTSAVVCSTLDVLHRTGGASQHTQLSRLVEDRRRDADARRAAEAELAGARFARRFVLVVPVGMALAGQSIGSGRAAFTTPAGQAAALLAVGVIGLCWFWSGRLLAVPTSSGMPT